MSFNTTFQTICCGNAHQQTALNCHRWQPPESGKVNRQYGIGDFKYVVICDAPTLGHVIRRMRFAKQTLYNGEAHQHTTLIVTAAQWKLHSEWAILGRGFQICGYLWRPYLGSRDTAHVHCAKNALQWGGSSANCPQLSPLSAPNCHRSPLKVAQWMGNMSSGIPNMWLFVTPLPWVTWYGACALHQKRFIMGRLISTLH